MTSKRLEVLLKLTSTANADSFAWYALALEYKGLGNFDEALTTFQKLRARDEEYVPMYLMCGSMLIEGQRHDDAREWLASGLAIAKRKGDAHAAGEIEGALATL